MYARGKTYIQRLESVPPKFMSTLNSECDLLGNRVFAEVIKVRMEERSF